jgi:hypothetical protein
MRVAVWDTYVRSRNGSVLHFDIIVPETLQDTGIIYDFGRQYLATIGEPASELSMEQCRFCHIEEPTADMLQAIDAKGFYILEMDAIPAHLPENPSRRDMILHLRAHSAEYRFANFGLLAEAEIRELVKGI